MKARKAMHTHKLKINQNMNFMMTKAALWSAVLWVYSLLVPLGAFLIITVWLVVADMVTGIAAAKYRKEPITSRGLRRTIIKMLLYTAAIISAQGMQLVFFNPAGLDAHLAFVVAGLVALTEFKSLLENVEAVTNVPFIARITEILPDMWKLLRPKKDDKKD
jgi:phage-related holin